MKVSRMVKVLSEYLDRYPDGDIEVGFDDKWFPVRTVTHYKHPDRNYTVSIEYNPFTDKAKKIEVEE